MAARTGSSRAAFTDCACVRKAQGERVDTVQPIAQANSGMLGVRVCACSVATARPSPHTYGCVASTSPHLNGAGSSAPTPWPPPHCPHLHAHDVERAPRQLVRRVSHMRQRPAGGKDRAVVVVMHAAGNAGRRNAALRNRSLRLACRHKTTHQSTQHVAHTCVPASLALTLCSGTARVPQAGSRTACRIPVWGPRAAWRPCAAAGPEGGQGGVGGVRSSDVVEVIQE